MDLEKELRQAMAEHAAESSAPTTLVADVRRRHHRRVMRIRTTVGVAATVGVAIAMVPTYNAFRVQVAPAGATGSPTDGRPSTTAVQSAPPSAPAPGPTGATAPAAPGATAKPSTRAPGQTGGAAPSSGVLPVRRWLAYVPQGLRQTEPCLDRNSGGKHTTTCEWTGPGGRIEVRLVRGSDLTKPEEILAVPGVPRYTSVHGRRAITLIRPDGAAQLVWVDRPGVGVLMTVSAPLRTELKKIAEGFQAPA